LSLAYLAGPPKLNEFAGPVALMLTLGSGAVRMAVAESNAVWCTLFWFRVSTAVYFGFGNIAPALSNISTRLYIDAYFWAQPHHLATLNLLVSASALCVLGGSTLLARLRQPRVRPPIHSEHKLLILGLLFAGLGFGVKAFVTIPYALGMFGENVVAASFTSLALMAPVSIFMLGRYAFFHRRSLLPVIVGLLLADMLLGTLLTNKSEVLLSLIMFLMAFLSRGVTVVTGSVALASLVTTLVLVTPVAQHGREQIQLRYDSIIGGTLEERFEILSSYYSSPKALPIDEEVQSIFVRLSYLNAAALAINEYDAGRRSDSLETAWMAFIPRALWPDKPITSDIGRNFNVLATGNPKSSSAPGIFPDAYYCLGWIGAPLLMIPIGLWFYALSRYALWVLATARWIHFPVVLMAMRMGFRVDGFIVTDIIGISVIICFMIVGAELAEKIYSMLWSRTPVRALSAVAGGRPAPDMWRE
jgi:hypothetical protein